MHQISLPQLIQEWFYSVFKFLSNVSPSPASHCTFPPTLLIRNTSKKIRTVHNKFPICVLILIGLTYRENLHIITGPDLAGGGPGAQWSMTATIVRAASSNCEFWSIPISTTLSWSKDWNKMWHPNAAPEVQILSQLEVYKYYTLSLAGSRAEPQPLLFLERLA